MTPDPAGPSHHVRWRDPIGAGLGVWLPTYLEQVRHLTVEGLSAYMGIQVIGGFVGCISAGHVLDALGRRRGLALFALGSALSAWAYVVLPLGAAWLVFAICFPLGIGTGRFPRLVAPPSGRPSVRASTRTRPDIRTLQTRTRHRDVGLAERPGHPRDSDKRVATAMSASAVSLLRLPSRFTSTASASAANALIA